MTSRIVQTMQERHSRAVDGIDVREGERPMDVFLHSFANQARRAAAV